jgi:hypothetical protein
MDAFRMIAPPDASERNKRANSLPSIGAVGHQRAIDDQAEPQDRTKAAKVSEHRRRAPIQFMLNKRRVNGPAASKQYLARVRCTAPEWIATILVTKIT